MNQLDLSPLKKEDIICRHEGKHQCNPFSDNCYYVISTERLCGALQGLNKENAFLINELVNVVISLYEEEKIDTISRETVLEMLTMLTNNQHIFFDVLEEKRWV